ncbi:hypothetical protein K438DRAFT_1926846 [Mycena galopus ATCC 62051]|nr:hypothetical protein K438DRAFT_1926846 [Mycena galopus ATCC 62051]
MPQLRLAPDLGPIWRFAYQCCLNFESWGKNHCSGRSRTASRLVPQLTLSWGEVGVKVGAEVEVKFLILKHLIMLGPALAVKNHSLIWGKTAPASHPVLETGALRASMESVVMAFSSWRYSNLLLDNYSDLAHSFRSQSLEMIDPHSVNVTWYGKFWFQVLIMELTNNGLG